ncbi:MAG: histidine kinase dimerization/phosphoacceptor domain-containing protein [Eggerthella lenta]
MNNRPMGPKDWGFDVAVTAAAFLFGCVQLMLAASSIVIPDLALRQYLGMVNVVPNVQVFVALAVTTLPLVVRRRFPWPVFLFCLVSFLGLQNAFNGFSLTIVGPVVALYTIASERGRAETVAAVLLAVAGLLFTDAHAATANMVLFTRFQNIVLAVAAGLAGYAYRTHRAYVKATEDRAAEAERTREEEAARRVEEERVRIAREVHDITAHSLSAVSIQAAAAERMIDRDPAAAKEAISAVRVTAKGALDDIRSMIGVLRRRRCGRNVADVRHRAVGRFAAYLETPERHARRGRYVRNAGPRGHGVVRHRPRGATNIVRHAKVRAGTSLAVGTRGRLVVEDDGVRSGSRARQPASGAAPGCRRRGARHSAWPTRYLWATAASRPRRQAVGRAGKEAEHKVEGACGCWYGRSRFVRSGFAHTDVVRRHRRGRRGARWPEAVELAGCIPTWCLWTFGCRV